MRILVIGPAWVGDMVMAQVLFRCLKALHPEATIDVCAPEWSRSLTERMPEVNHSLSLKLGHGQWGWGARKALGQSLKGQYDFAYVLPNSWKSALIPFWAGIPERVGYVGEWRFGLLNRARRLNKTVLPLMIERFAALAYPTGAVLPDPLPKPRLVVHPDNVRAALARYGLKAEKPILAMCPGAEFGPSKRWPETYYADIANRALAVGKQVWIFGSPKDSIVAKAIMDASQQACVDLTGKTSLGDAIDLLSLASQVLSNDSGLMHIAAALDRPLVAVYGSTDPSFTPPLSDHATIVRTGISCSPCFKRECPLGHHRCMKDLSVEQVWQALQKGDA